MQFGIVGVPPYRATAPDCGALTGTGAGNTWARYRDARDNVDFPPGTNEDRPPACREVPPKHGCVYADADAIAAAAAYLHDLGAGPELDDRAWRAAQRYNGAAAYADAVLARARAWEAELNNGANLAAAPTTPGARARLGPDGLARAPENAPPEVRRAIAAANAISDRPYLLRHYPTHIGNPTYDCSSSSSHVLWGAGAFGRAPWVSGQFMRFGNEGPGRWITVYANDGHMFLIVAGLRFSATSSARRLRRRLRCRAESFLDHGAIRQLRHLSAGASLALDSEVRLTHDTRRGDQAVRRSFHGEAPTSPLMPKCVDACTTLTIGGRVESLRRSLECLEH